jgi:hypothetical protein
VQSVMGDITAAIEIAEAGVKLAAGTEESGLRADALAALAFVQSRATWQKEARASLDEALALLNAKGDRARARLLAPALTRRG